MHLKNFSLLKDKNGGIGMSPAYDLLATRLVMPEDNEQMALSQWKKESDRQSGFPDFCRVLQDPKQSRRERVY